MHRFRPFFFYHCDAKVSLQCGYIGSSHTHHFIPLANFFTWQLKSQLLKLRWNILEYSHFNLWRLAQFLDQTNKHKEEFKNMSLRLASRKYCWDLWAHFIAIFLYMENLIYLRPITNWHNFVLKWSKITVKLFFSLWKTSKMCAILQN